MFNFTLTVTKNLHEVWCSLVQYWLNCRLQAISYYMQVHIDGYVIIT